MAELLILNKMEKKIAGIREEISELMRLRRYFSELIEELYKLQPLPICKLYEIKTYQEATHQLECDIYYLEKDIDKLEGRQAHV